MSVNIFEKILRIIQVLVTILQFVLKQFTGQDPAEDVDA